jgi:uncharacterized protein YhhL (DUF1145 family)
MVEIVLNNTCEVSAPQQTRQLRTAESALGVIRSNVATNDPNDIISGLENVTVENFVQIFPNPVRNELRIATAENLIIKGLEIVDLSGKTYYQINKSTNQVDVSALPQGVYFVRIETDKGIVAKRFVKE